MPQVSFADAKPVDELIGFDPGLPSFNPALSILKAFASLRVQVAHGTQITTGIGVAFGCVIALLPCDFFAPVSFRFHRGVSTFESHEDFVRVAEYPLGEVA